MTLPLRDCERFAAIACACARVSPRATSELVIRERICEGLGFLGIELDAARNARDALLISTDSGRVKVRVEPVETAIKPEESLAEFVKRSRRELEAAGHKFMNEEEVTAWIDELRSDDDRIEQISRGAEEEKRPREQGL